MAQSKRPRRKSKAARPVKPAKPYPDFPLFPHATGRWAKKIRGRLYYFGPWPDALAALNKFNAQRDDLYAGRKPRASLEGLTMRELCNQFLNSKRRLLESGDLKQRTFEEYKAVTDLLIERFTRERLVEDLRPEDFEQLRARMAKRWGPVTLKNTIQRVRSVFKYAADNQLIPRPVCYGQGFRRPSAKMLRAARNAKGAVMFEPDEIKAMLAAAGVQLRAMILLGINCGFGNNDCGCLPLSALDLKRGWVNFPRPKTEIPRRCPLWPETVEALCAALDRRPSPKAAVAADLVFVTQRGLSWSKDIIANPISAEMRKLLNALGIKGRRNFYALRHTFETIGGETDRQTAVSFIMGHVPHDDDMSAVYRERIGDDRLRAVTDHVRAWLFEPANQPPDKLGEEE
jgi:integrase